MPVTSWSTTASANATADSASGVNFAEGQAPSSINDSMRSLMAVIKGDFANSLSGTGYQKFPNGFILQWGTTIATCNTNGNAAVAWPLAFPNIVFTAIGSTGDPTVSGNETVGVLAPPDITATGASFSFRPNPGAVSRRVNWVAFGR